MANPPAYSTPSRPYPTFEKAPASSQTLPEYTAPDPNERFQGRKWNDVWCAVLFLLQLVGVFVISWYFKPSTSLSSIFVSVKDTYGKYSELREVAKAYAVSIASAVILFSGFILLCREYTQAMIHAGFIASIVASLAIAGWFTWFFGEFQYLSLLMVLSGILSGLVYLVQYRKIPFTAMLLRHVMKSLDKHPATWLFTPFSIIADICISTLYLVVAAEIVYEHRGLIFDMDNMSIFCLCYLVLSFFWTMQVFENVVSTSVAGLFSAQYFLKRDALRSVSPLLASIRRAVTYSFGSICLGSLLVAIIQFSRFMLKSMSKDNDKRNVAKILMGCLLDIIEDLARYFNFYAYVYVAIYGKPYVESAKQAWGLLKSKGIDTILNDDAAGGCLMMGVMLVAYASAMICYWCLGDVDFYMDMSAPYMVEANCIFLSITSRSVFSFIIFVLVMIIGTTATQVIKTGISTIFVCYAEEPEILGERNPGLREKLHTRYPWLVA